jgi:hypothetical protein
MSDRFKHVEAMGKRLNVPIPKDENGFLGRECPAKECLGYFKVKPGTGLTGPGLVCHCPYCGQADDPNSFWTKEQIEYAKSVAFRQLADAVRKDLKQFEFDYPARGAFGIGISMKLKPGPLPPLRHYREQKLETDVVCDGCTLHYAVFGLFAYCPDCGIHNSLQVLQRNLALVAKQIELAASVESQDLARHLVEDGLENCVSAFDGFARETCRVRAAHSQDPGRAANLSFQNLGNATTAVRTLFGVNLSSAVDAAAWDRTTRAFFKRHLLAHRSGVIDEKYVQSSGDATAVVGRRISIKPAEVTDVANTVAHLGRALVNLLPKP